MRITGRRRWRRASLGEWAGRTWLPSRGPAGGIACSLVLDLALTTTHTRMRWQGAQGQEGRERQVQGGGRGGEFRTPESRLLRVGDLRGCRDTLDSGLTGVRTLLSSFGNASRSRSRWRRRGSDNGVSPFAVLGLARARKDNTSADRRTPWMDDVRPQSNT